MPAYGSDFSYLELLTPLPSTYFNPPTSPANSGMDFVFLDKNQIQTQLGSVDGNIYYKIDTRFPSTSVVPTTTITATRKGMPLERISPQEFRKLPGTEGEEVGKIEWKCRVRPGRLHSKFIPGAGEGDGCLSRSFLKRPHSWSLNDRILYFKGHDGVKYCWKAYDYGTCILKRVKDKKQVAWGGKRRIQDGLFRDQIRNCLHVKHPENVTLDLSVILMTYLYVDHKRSVEELGVDWAPYTREEPDDNPELPFWPDP